MRAALLACLAACSSAPQPAPAAPAPAAPDAAPAVPDAPPATPDAATALTTRAHPFAIHVARMHVRIHERWSNGFLRSLDARPPKRKDPLSSRDLGVELELAVNEDGTLHHVGIVQTSGATAFDAAALDAVIASAPFEATPVATRSSDGKMYLRWTFFRDERECSTGSVRPLMR
jgi:TonB family protein